MTGPLVLHPLFLTNSWSTSQLTISCPWCKSLVISVRTSRSPMEIWALRSATNSIPEKTSSALSSAPWAWKWSSPQSPTAANSPYNYIYPNFWLSFCFGSLEITTELCETLISIHHLSFYHLPLLTITPSLLCPVVEDILYSLSPPYPKDSLLSVKIYCARKRLCSQDKWYKCSSYWNNTIYFEYSLSM